jgi:hypothetical protein
MSFLEEVESAVTQAHTQRIEDSISAEKANRTMPPQLEARVRGQMAAKAHMYAEEDRGRITISLLMDEIDSLRARLEALEAP